jgi:hypothetical protein
MAGKSLGDLEYEKFDSNGVVKIEEQSPREIEELLERQVILLERINSHLEVQIKYLQEFFVGGILDDHVGGQGI